MSAELNNVAPSESRVALIIENGILQEIHVERHTKRGLVGNIYRGKVSRVLQGMQAAFVDIGLEKAAFLHASDIVIHNEIAEEVSGKPYSTKTLQLVRDGQDIVVQVVKDPIGTKGALYRFITIPSRYLVFMPSVTHVGVSQRIEEKLKESAKVAGARVLLMKTVASFCVLRLKAWAKTNCSPTQHFCEGCGIKFSRV